MRKSSRIALSLLLVLGLVFAATALVGCSKGGDGGTDTAEVKDGGTLKFYLNEPAYIDPYNCQETEGTQVTSELFDSLLAVDPLTSELVPAAAEKWEANADSSVWTFHLRKGATFHNGDPVNAESFVYAWTRLVDPKTNPEDPSVIAYHLAPVKGYNELLEGKATTFEGVKALDDLTLEVTLYEPWADFGAVCSHPALAPVPQKAVEADPEAYAQAPVGNGPFKMEGKWEHNQYIKVVRFDDYYGEKAHVDGVDFMIYDEAETGFREFEAGNLDYAQVPDGRMKEMVEANGEAEKDGYVANPGKQTFTGAETSTYYILLNMKNDILKNKDLREAISYGINREQISDTLKEGFWKPATGIVPPGIVGFQEDAWPTSKYDFELAKQKLADAGYPEGKKDGKQLELTLACNTGGGHDDTMQMIQSDLSKLGIKVTLNMTEWAQHLEIMQSGKYEMGRLGWVADYPIMDNFLYPLFYSTSGDNRSGYVNADFDKGVTEARTIADEDARIEKYRSLEKLVGEETPHATLMFYAHNYIASNRVNNLTLSPNKLADLDKCWLTNGGK